jgi:anti-sigma factor (TIGR02949 family)
MDCQEVQGLLDAYLDGDFGEQEKAAIAAHLDGCPRCSEVVRFGEVFRRRLRESQQEPAAPAGLERRIRRALAEAEPRDSWMVFGLRWLVPAAAAVALMVGVVVSKRSGRKPDAVLAQQSVEWHRRQLPMDVTGSSPDTIRRFFSDKVPFAVRPPVFEQPRVRLEGGRLANLKEHTAAYLVYQVGGERVSVFIFDSNALPPSGTIVRVGPRRVRWHRLRGYSVALYSSGGTGYAVASEMDHQRMIQLIAHSK